MFNFFFIYLNRFTKIFTPLKPTAKLLCEYFFEIKPAKIRELRIDTLSQMMTLANVHAGSNYIVIDDIQGLLLGAVMERTGRKGKIVAIHEHNQFNANILPFFNIPEDEIKDSLITYPWYRLLSIEPFKEEKTELERVKHYLTTTKPEDINEKMIRKREKLESRIRKGEQIYEFINNTKFDG